MPRKHTRETISVFKAENHDNPTAIVMRDVRKILLSPSKSRITAVVHHKLTDGKKDPLSLVFRDSKKLVPLDWGKGSVRIPAVKVKKNGILSSKRALRIIAKGKVDPFPEVSRNLAERSASVFDRYKHLTKRGD